MFGLLNQLFWMAFHWHYLSEDMMKCVKEGDKIKATFHTRVHLWTRTWTLEEDQERLKTQIEQMKEQGWYVPQYFSGMG